MLACSIINDLIIKHGVILMKLAYDILDVFYTIDNGLYRLILLLLYNFKFKFVIYNVYLLNIYETLLYK